MKAQQMFMELGWNEMTKYLDISIRVSNGKSTIHFYLIDKTWNHTDWYIGRSDGISVDLHQAITQQMEELGWINV